MSKANMTYREADSVDCAASPSCSEQGCHTACGSVHARQGSLGSSRSQGRRGRVFWWSVSGTLLSVVGFIGLALFEQYNSSLSELRADGFRAQHRHRVLLLMGRGRKIFRVGNS